MGIRRSRKTGSVDKPQQQAAVERDYVAEVQCRVAKLTEATERAAGPLRATTLAGKQRQHIEREMASLRAETLKARRLAEQIENMSHTTRHKRERVMTESFTINPDRAEHRSRRKADTPKSGGNQMSFNPLHPSMELPPEQLIRLLGLETKKIRKGKKAGGRAQEKSRVTPRPVDALAGEKRQPAHAQAATLIPRISTEQTALPPESRKKRTRILFPATVTGVLVGLAVAGYLFISKPPVTATQAPATAAAPNASSSKAPQSAQRLVAPEQFDRTIRPARSAASAPVSDTAINTTPVVTKPPTPDDSVAATVTPERQAAIDAELANLRVEAEQRFAREMSRIEASRELERLQAPMGDAPKTTLPVLPTGDGVSNPDAGLSRAVDTGTGPTTQPPKRPEDHQIGDATLVTPAPAGAATRTPIAEDAGATTFAEPPPQAPDNPAPQKMHPESQNASEPAPSQHSTEEMPVKQESGAVPQANPTPDPAAENTPIPGSVLFRSEPLESSPAATPEPALF